MTTENRPVVVPAVYVLLRRTNRILLLLRQNTNYYDGHYSLPAGHVKLGESPLQAAVREVYEETGVSIESNDCTLVHTMYRAKTDPTGDRLDLFFETNRWVGEPVNYELKKSKEAVWFSTEALPGNVVPNQQAALESIKSGILYSELDFTDSHL